MLAHVARSFNYRHARLAPGVEGDWLLRAFQRDFKVNGPSVARVSRTTLAGWLRYRDHADPRIRARFEWEARGLAVKHAGMLWAARKWYRHDESARRGGNRRSSTVPRRTTGIE